MDVGFGCVDVGYWLFGRWIFVGWTLDFGCVVVEFRFGGCWTLVVLHWMWMLDVGFVDVGFWLNGNGCSILVVWTLVFDCVDDGF